MSHKHWTDSTDTHQYTVFHLMGTGQAEFPLWGGWSPADYLVALCHLPNKIDKDTAKSFSHRPAQHELAGIDGGRPLGPG